MFSMNFPCCLMNMYNISVASGVLNYDWLNVDLVKFEIGQVVETIQPRKICELEHEKSKYSFTNNIKTKNAY